MKPNKSKIFKIIILSLIMVQATPSYGFLFGFFGRRASRGRFISQNNSRPSNQGQSRGGRIISGQNSSINSNNSINGSGLEEIVGFSNLLKNGNALVERNARGETRSLFIDGAGNLLGATEANTVRQAKEFFLLNRDKFNQGQRQTVDRFLARNGGISDGRFTIDLKNIVVPDEIAAQGPQRSQEFALASLNFLLNTLQTNVRLKIDRVKPDGTIDLDLSRFFRGEALAILKAADPTSACTGKIRLDRLIAFAMDPPNYYKFINAPATRAQVAAAVGIQEDKTTTQGNKLLVGTNPDGEYESGVTRNIRVLEVQSAQRVPGSSCYRSFDGIDRNAPGQQQESRDPRQKGINFTHDAEEWLCLGRNGMMQGFLFNAKGDLLTRAPAEIATGAVGTVGPAVSAIAACLDCHANGFIAGGALKDGGGKQYTDRFNDIPDTNTVFRNTLGTTLTHRDFFTQNATYRQRAVQDSNIFINAQRATGSFFSLNNNNEAMALLPKMIRKFDDPLKPKDVASALGVSEAEAKQVIPPGDNAIDRTTFEAKFCSLRVGSTLGGNETQSREQLRTETGINNFPTHRR